jgi:hypothetical protein
MTRQESRRDQIAVVEDYRSQCVQVRRGVSQVNSRIAALQPLQVLIRSLSALICSVAL